jgi:CheY-like chemotaxis protein
MQDNRAIAMTDSLTLLRGSPNDSMGARSDADLGEALSPLLPFRESSHPHFLLSSVTPKNYSDTPRVRHHEVEMTIKEEVGQSSQKQQQQQQQQQLSMGVSNPVVGAAVPSAASRVLVVEDSPVNQKLVVRLLKMLGYASDTANNGQEALDQMAAFVRATGTPYSLVYMDLNMPVMDGWEATTRLRESGYTLPIVALTANALEESRRKCMEGGFSGFITKPFDKSDLEQILNQYHIAPCL